MNTLERSALHPALSDGLISLRRFTSKDAQAFVAIHQDPLNVKWAGSVPDMDISQAADLIEGSIAAGWDAGTSLRFAIVDHPEGAEYPDRVVGTLSLQDVFSTVKGGSASVGIKMLPAGRGTGCAQRAMELLCGYAYGNLGLEILHWRCTAGNSASVSLAQRCGFIRSAEIPGFGIVDAEVSNGLIYTQTQGQWADRDHRITVAPVVPVLGDDLVILRALTMADAPQLVENCRNLESVRWTTVPLDYTMEHAQYFINTLTPEGWRTGETLTFAVADPETDQLLGTVDLQCKNPAVASVGINFGAHARGTGVAQAATHLLLDYAFSQLNLRYVHWSALVPNWGSRKLAWKLGFTFDGRIRGEFNDRGTPGDRWVLSLAAGEQRSPQEPWTGPAPLSR